jgi:transposase
VACHPKKGLKLGAVIGFQDESGYADKPIVRYTWSKRGSTPIIQSAGGWKRRTAVGTLLCKADGTNPRFVFTVQKQDMNKEGFVRYLKKLKRHMRDKKLILFVDGLAAHKAKIVRAWIDQEKNWLTVHRFPAYDPEDNPAEYVWSASKTKDMAHYLPKNMPALERRVRKSFRRINQSKSILKGCLRASGRY